MKIRSFINTIIYAALTITLTACNMKIGDYNTEKCREGVKKLEKLDFQKRIWTYYKLSVTKKAVDDFINSTDPLTPEYFKTTYQNFLDYQAQLNNVDTMFQLQQAKIAAECSGDKVIKKEYKKSLKDSLINSVTNSLLLSGLPSTSTGAGTSTGKSFLSKEELLILKKELQKAEEEGF